VDNPDGGAPLYQVATYLTKEGTEYTKSVRLDKSKNKDGCDDDMFEELDIDFTMQRSGKTAAQLVEEMPMFEVGPIEQKQIHNVKSVPNASSGSSGSGTGSATQALPLEDAKEWDKLQCKVEEGLRNFAKLSVMADKAIAALSNSTLGMKRKDAVIEMLKVCRDKTETLHHIAVHGTVPGHSAKLGTVGLRNIVSEFSNDFQALQQGVQMAQPLMKKVDKDK